MTSAMATDVAESDYENDSLLSHIPAILKQRFWFLAIPALVFGIAATAAAFLLTPRYESQSVLLVESPLLAEDDSGFSADVVDQRMARIRQQVLSRPQLIQLIRQNNLYASEIASTSLSDVVEAMRDATTLKAVTADVDQSGRNSKSTIAFSLSFQYSDPIKAQTIAQALTEQVLQLDASATSEQAQDAVQFLTDQASALQQQMAELQNKISDIKAKNGMALSSGGGFPIFSGSGSYDAQIAALQRENRQLSSQKETAQSLVRDPAVLAAETELASVRARYSDTHPDVALARQRLAEARKLASSNLSKQPLDTIDAQIASNNSQIAALQAARSREDSRMSAMMSAQARGPVVQQQISELETQLETLNQQYNGVSNRLLAARAGKKADEQQQGERLTVIEPPAIPEEPSFPDRPKIIGAGLLAGLGLGAAIIFLLEQILKPIRDVQAVRAVCGEYPLVVIPNITPKEKSPKKTWRKRLWPFGR